MVNKTFLPPAARPPKHLSHSQTGTFRVGTAFAAITANRRAWESPAVPAIREAAVIGIPDPTTGEMVKAFVALKPGFEAGEALNRELLGHARKRLGAAVAPKAIDFRVNLPKTRSGKIMRRLLKARELGLPEGDLSTLESDEQK